MDRSHPTHRGLGKARQSVMNGVRALTWNLQWVTPRSRRAAHIRDRIESLNASVLCLTETSLAFAKQFGHAIDAEPDFGYPIVADRRKVVLVSDEPWSEADQAGDPSMPPGRFISGVTHGIRFIGVCIPWSMAHVTTGRKDARRWTEHTAYLTGLAKVVSNALDRAEPVCLLGDFNQRLPRTTQPAQVEAALLTALGPSLRVITSGPTGADGTRLIDHIAIDARLQATTPSTFHPNQPPLPPLSDHTAVFAELARTTAL
jgi:hypothetical protein